MAARSSFLFTSESVSEGHPDKVADRISDTVVDAFLSKDPEARVACETLVTTQRIVLADQAQQSWVKGSSRDETVEIAMKNPKEPLLLDLTAPSFAIYSAKLVTANGGTAAPGADQCRAGDDVRPALARHVDRPIHQAPP